MSAPTSEGSADSCSLSYFSGCFNSEAPGRPVPQVTVPGGWVFVFLLRTLERMRVADSCSRSLWIYFSVWGGGGRNLGPEKNNFVLDPLFYRRYFICLQTIMNRS
jgi:hypothetical protein